MKHGVVEEQSTIEAIIDARRERAKLSALFARKLTSDAYGHLIATAEAYPSPEENLEHKLLRAAVEAAATIEGFDGPLESTLYARLAEVFRCVERGGVNILFPDQ